MADMRTCIGSEKFGIPRHEAPIEDFPAQPSQKDGLGRMCKEHWTAYTRALRLASSAAKGTTTARKAEKAAAAKAPTKPKPKGRRERQPAAEKAMRVPIVHTGETDRSDEAPTTDQLASDLHAALEADPEAEMLAERRERIKARRRQEFTEASLNAQAAAGAKMEA